MPLRQSKIFTEHIFTLRSYCNLWYQLGGFYVTDKYPTLIKITSTKNNTHPFLIILFQCVGCVWARDNVHNKNGQFVSEHYWKTVSEFLKVCYFACKVNQWDSQGLIKRTITLAGLIRVRINSCTIRSSVRSKWLETTTRHILEKTQMLHLCYRKLLLWSRYK